MFVITDTELGFDVALVDTQSEADKISSAIGAGIRVTRITPVNA